MIMKDRNYIQPEDLRQEFIQYKTTGQMSNRLGEMFMTMCDRILRHSNFNGYTQDLKEEMKSYANLLFCRYAHNIDPNERDGRQVFNYVTAIIFSAYKQTLKKFYKVQNLKREITDAYILLFNTTYGTDISNEYLNNFKLEEKTND